MRLAALACALVALPAAAGELPVNIQDGASWTQTIAKTRTDEKDGATTSTTVTSVIRATYHRRGAGPATLDQELMSIASPGVPAAELAQAESQARLVFPAVVEVDQDLRPARVVGWDKMKAAFSSLARSEGADAKAIEAATAMFARIDDVAATNFFKELGLISLGQGTSLEPGQQVSYDDQVPNIMGGPPIRATGVIRLVSHDEKAGRAVVTWTQSLDPASARASLTATVEAIAARLDPGKAADARRELAALTLDRQDSCRYEIHAATGLATRVECRVVLTTGTPGKMTRRTEQWDITQSLPETR